MNMKYPSQLLHDCMGVLTKDIADLSEETIYAEDAGGRIFPLRVFLMVVIVYGADVSLMCINGRNSPCCTVGGKRMSRTEITLNVRSGP